MSDANRTAIRVSREQSFKAPYPNPLFQPLRITSAALKFEPDTVTSNEIDPMRQITDQPLVGFTSGGNIPMELSIGNADILLPGLFMNHWTRTPEVLNGASYKYGSGSAASTRIQSMTSTTLTLAANSVIAGSGPTSHQNPATVFSAGQLMYFSGMGVPDQILKVTGSSATTVSYVGGVAVAAAPATARVKVVGFEAAAGDVQSVTAGGNGFSSTTLNFTLMNLTVGQWVYLASPSTYGFAAFSGWARVSSISANFLGFDLVPTGFVADSAAGKTIRVFFTDSIRNGIVEDFSYYVEEEFGLGSITRYLYHRGQTVNSRVISADTKAIITDTFDLMGADALPVTAVRATGAVSLSVGTGSILNSSTAIPLFYENGSPVVGPNFVNSFTLSMDNKKRMRDAVGILGAASIGSGRIDVTGNLSTYFGNETLYNKVISNAVSSITFGLNDPAAMRAEIYDIPKLKFTSGAPDVTGIDTDIFVPLAYQGLRDIAAGRDYTVLLSRFEYYL